MWKMKSFIYEPFARDVASASTLTHKHKCLMNKKDNAENVENEVKSWQNSQRNEGKGTEMNWNETKQKQY